MGLYSVLRLPGGMGGAGAGARGDIFLSDSGRIGETPANSSVRAGGVGVVAPVWSVLPARLMSMNGRPCDREKRYERAEGSFGWLGTCDLFGAVGVARVGSLRDVGAAAGGDQARGDEARGEGAEQWER